jgi:hypothetical protein
MEPTERDPYLPPLVPSDNPAAAPKKSARGTIIVWIVLAVAA